MKTSYDVRFQKTYVYKGTRTTTYWVRWSVAGRPFKEPHKNAALANSFRAELVSAASKGEAFDTASGRPVSSRRAHTDMPWYEFACSYVDMKWLGAAANTRRSIAESLVTATCSLLVSDRGKPDEKVIRAALFQYGFNSVLRNDPAKPEAMTDALWWLQRKTRNVSELANPEVLRAVLNALARKLDGTAAAASVVNRKRAVLFNALEYAVERKLLIRNPIPELKWKAPKVTHEVDRRSVVNPVQARTLLRAVAEVQRSGPHLAACYACSYYSALRPEEAINLREHSILLPALVWNRETEDWDEPENGWGEFHLEKAAPHAGKRWTDDGKPRDSRGLKHRTRSATRVVPIPPELTRILRTHLSTFGTDNEGRLFRSVAGGEVPARLYNLVWRKARAATFTPAALASPLARVPYDLRHACVSTWLRAGVEATRVAEWAGHSVEVLYKVYAKCLDGQEEEARRRIESVMR